MLKYIVAALISASVAVALVGFFELMKRGRRVPERLQALKAEGKGAEASPLMDRPLPFYLRAVAAVGWCIPNLMTSESLRWDLARAGWRHAQARGVFAGSKVIATILFGGGVALVATRIAIRQDERLLLIVTAAAVGFVLPNMFLGLMQGRRSQEILLALPDALDLMVICVEAGQGLNAAILIVGREIRLRTPSLSDEFRMVNHEIRAGLSRAQALRNFANRTGIEDTRSLVAVLVQSDRMGTSITQALRAHAQSLRIRRRQRAEEAARKTAVKLVFPLVFCIFPALLVVLLAPGMIQVVEALAQSGKG